MPSPADPVNALIAFLELDDNVVALVGARIDLGEITRKRVPHMPMDMVVVRGAGGPNRLEPSLIPWRDGRIDVLAYGRTERSAQAVSDAVWLALRQLAGFSAGGSRIYAAECEMEPQRIKDPDRDWIYYLSSWRVSALAVAA